MTHEQLEEATKSGTGELRITAEDWSRIVLDRRNVAKFTPMSSFPEWDPDNCRGAGRYNGVMLRLADGP